MSEQIKCPKCGHEFAMTEAMTQQIQESLRLEFNQKWKDEKAKLEAQIRKSAEEATAEQTAKLKADLDASLVQIEKDRKERESLLERERALVDKERELRAESDKRIETERKLLEEKSREKLEAEKSRLREEQSQEMQFLKEQNEEKTKKLQEAKDLELKLLREKQALAEREQNLELEVTRKVAETRAEVESATRKRADEEHQMKLAEKEKQLSDVMRQLEEAKRKAEQGSQQTQGEILELELEEQLRSHFPDDDIQPVAKGVRGGDVVQKISVGGEPCSIIWEVKNTKNWTDGWVPKLKQDMRECKADMAVLVTRALPKEITSFGEKDGIMVTDFASAIALAFVLRANLINISYERMKAEGASVKSELVYKYITGSEFRQRIEAIVENFKNMQEELNREKRAIQKIWNVRAAQIDVMQQSTIAIYGRLHGIIGNALSEIPVLELPDSDIGETPPASGDGNGGMLNL